MKTIGARGTRSRKISTGCFLLCVDSKRKKEVKGGGGGEERKGTSGRGEGER